MKFANSVALLALASSAVAQECVDAPASNNCDFPSGWKISDTTEAACKAFNTPPESDDSGDAPEGGEDACSKAIADNPCWEYVGGLSCNSVCGSCVNGTAQAPCKEDYMDIKENCADVYDACFKDAYEAIKDFTRECGDDRVKWGSASSMALSASVAVAGAFAALY
jgi:hypothetical protein